ncbi:hypothetical protein JYK22_19930, partial [Nonomuraea sp. RK-328]|nr:hypothetical protein [Nonomuraea sp. RK-328]
MDTWCDTHPALGNRPAEEQAESVIARAQDLGCLGDVHALSLLARIQSRLRDTEGVDEELDQLRDGARG